MSNIIKHVLSLLPSSQFTNESLEGCPLLCFVKLVKLYNGIKTGDKESLYFLDGLGRPSSGILDGNTLLLGDYDLCQQMKDSSKGYYLPCSTNAELQLAEIPAHITWTTCLPEECHGETFTQLINTTVLPKLAEYNVTISNVSTQCQTPTHWDIATYIALGTVLLFLVFSLVGTLWDPIAEIITSFYDTDTSGLVIEDAEEEDDELLINAAHDDDDAVPSGSEGVTPTNGVTHTADNADTLHSTDSKKRATLNAIGAVMRCFSLERCMSVLVSTDIKAGQVLCLNGIRVLSINWVVLGHVYYLPWVLGTVGDSVYGMGTLLNRASFQYITNGVLAVDSFFLISGFLVSYLLLKELATRAGSFNVLSYTVHRYIRLTVPYLVVILVEGFLYPALIQGPFTGILAHNNEVCKQYMWTNLLYINNFVPWSERKFCIGQSWYLANDFQFYLLAPIFIITLYRKPRIGHAVLWAGIAASVAAAGISYYHYGFNMANAGSDAYFLHQYIKPWIRAPPYLIGVLGGWVCWRYDVRATGPVWRRAGLSCVLWCVTLVLQWSVLQGRYQDMNIHHNKESQTKDMLYEMLSRPVWGIALLVQILTMHAGLGGWINSVLSWRGMLPLARLTYGVYLLHIGLLTLLLTQLRHPWFVAPDYEVAVLYCGVLLVSYIAAALLYLIVEQPISFLEKLCYKRS